LALKRGRQVGAKGCSLLLGVGLAFGFLRGAFRFLRLVVGRRLSFGASVPCTSVPLVGTSLVRGLVRLVVGLCSRVRGFLPGFAALSAA